MLSSYGIVVFLIGSIQCSSFMEEDFFNLTFSKCPINCVNRCFEDQRELTDTFNVKKCKCDPDCVLFGDCCIGFYTFCNVFLYPSDAINFMKSKRDKEKNTEEENKIADFKEKAQCELFIPSYDSEVYIWAINACPVKYPDGEIKDKCTGNQLAFPLDIPVSIPALPYWLFKNVYCALCHNFTLDDVLYWQSEIRCYIRNGDDIKTVEQFTDYIPDIPCKTVVSLPDDNIKVRFCDPIPKPRCTEIKQDLPNSLENTTLSLTDESFNRDGNISSPDSEGLIMNNTVSQLIPFQHDDAIEVITQANLDVLCNAYKYDYSVIEGGDRIRYFNPHCRACEVGLQNFDRTEIIPCKFDFGHTFDAMPMNSRLVRFQFGIFEKYIYFFSMESKSLLESSYPKCSADKYFELVTKSCELYQCPQDYFPYYQNCMPTSLTINATIFKDYPLQSTLYVKTNVILLMEAGNTFKEITDYVLDSLSESELDAYRPQNIYHPTILPLNIKMNALNILRFGKLTFPASGEVIYVDGLVKVDVEIPVLFNDLNQTITNFRENSLFQPDSTLVSNYPENSRLACYNARPKTYTNLDLILHNKRAFVEIDGVLVDLVETKFTLRISNLTPLQVLTIDVCRPSSRDSLMQSYPTEDKQCDYLTSELSQFLIINDSLKISDQFIIQHDDFFINGDKVNICFRALKGYTSSVDRSLKTIFKNVSSATSMIFKILAFIISLISRDHPGTVYFQSLGITCTLIDFIHLLENLSFHNSEERLAVLLHLAWLLAAYSLCAWCMNMVCCNSKRTMKCLCRHLFISLVVPILTVVVCATGDVNTPPWNIGYGSNGKILSAQMEVILYGYIIPFALGITWVLICHIYRISRRKSFKKSKSFYSCHILITGLLTLQFGFGCSEALSELSVYYLLYFAVSILVSWSFILIACQGLRQPKTRLSNPSRYLQSTNNNPYSVPIQTQIKTKPAE